MWTFVGILLVVALATASLFIFTRRHPEEAADHVVTDRRGSGLFYGDVDDRPGSPGAEADGVADRGMPAPGPSAESPPRRR